MKFIVTAAAFALLATPALAGGAIPDGTYQCAMDGYLQGEMVIQGNTYMGPNYDGQYDGRYTFSVSGRNLHFNGPIGIYSDPSMQFLGALLADDGNGGVGIELHIKLADSDNIHQAYCTIE